MIRIVDRTLSCIDEFSPSKQQLNELITLLFYCDADCLEMSQKVYERLGSLPDFGSYVLRVNTPEEADEYKMFDTFVCERNSDCNRHVYAELFVNDARDSNLIMHHQNDKMVRITGLGDLFRQSIESRMEYLKNFISKNTEYCPENSYGCAVAAAVEWVGHGMGNSIVTSFGGIGSYAPFEEVLISMRQLFRRHPQTNYEFLPQIQNIFSEITGYECSVYKPVTGDGIFTVESGIHIDGILKHPKCYEPFPPESVGTHRKFTCGKFSGRSAVGYKISELGISLTEKELLVVTERVKALSAELNRSLCDEEIAEISEQVKKIT